MVLRAACSLLQCKSVRCRRCHRSEGICCPHPHSRDVGSQFLRKVRTCRATTRCYIWQVSNQNIIWFKNESLFRRDCAWDSSIVYELQVVLCDISMALCPLVLLWDLQRHDYLSSFTWQSCSRYWNIYVRNLWNVTDLNACIRHEHISQS